LAAAEKADYTLRIGPRLVELALDHIGSTTLYNGQSPGPLLRFKEEPVVVDIDNETDAPERVHMHGQMIPSAVDGAAEEGSPFIPPRGVQRLAFVPKPAGFASTIRMSCQRATSAGAPTPGKRDPFTSSRRPIPVPTIARKAGATAAAPHETIDITVVKHYGAADGFNIWTLNGEALSMKIMTPKYTVHEGRRYRRKLRNASDDVHPLHLHRHSFELTRIGGKPTAGVIKDVVMLGEFPEVEFDFLADNPGLTLFHCH
jgi:FtsP/CotA-like multicopper oxidase with cupredoxin domain